MTDKHSSGTLLRRIEELENELQQVQAEYTDYKTQTEFELNVFHSLMDITPLGVFWKDRDSRYLGCSKTFAIDSGKENIRDIIGLFDEQLYWPGAAKAYKAIDHQVLETKAPTIIGSEVFKMPNKKPRRVDKTKIPLLDDTEEVVGILGVYSDITTLRKTQKELRSIANDLKIIFESVMVGIAAIEDGCFVDVNPKFLEITGYDLEEVLGASCSLLKPVKLDDSADDNWPSGKNFTELDTIVQCKDGKVIHVLISCKMVATSEETSRSVLSLQDISERVTMENDLMDSQIMFKKIFTNLHQGAIILEPIVGDKIDLKVTHVNHYAQENLQFLGALNGFTLSQLPKLSKCLVDRLLQCYYSQKDDLAGIVHAENFPNKPWFDVVLLYLPTSEIVILFNDVTEQIETRLQLERQNEELIQAKDKAEESDRLKSAFLANMSHEIRTPMNGILGFTDLLSCEDLSLKQRNEYLEVIKQSGDRMLSTVNDIIDISKIEANEVKLDIDEFCISEIMEYLYNFFTVEAHKKSLVLLCDTECINSELTLRSDKCKIQAILTNLIKNAIKCTAQGYVKFGFHHDAGVLEFFVEDTGIGIPLCRQTAIWERFVQVDIEDKNAYEGSGLGLSIVKAYVDMLNGYIDLVSELNVGTTFKITLPITSVYTKEAPVCANDTPKKISKTINILVAEDDFASAKLLKIILDKAGFSTLFVTNGQEAIDRYKQLQNFDLILMDIKMPIKSGLDATKEIRTFDKNIPIIAQTAFGFSGDEEKAIAVGCNGYITKPINASDLFELIENVV